MTALADRPLLVLTDRSQAAHPLPDVVAAAAAAGATAIVLRENDLAHDDRARLAKRCRSAIGSAALLIGASELVPGTDGVHLAAVDPPAPSEAPVVGRSCHGEAELRAAVVEGVDYVTLSPVFESPSKPGYGPAIGLAGLRAQCEHLVGHKTRLIALGGIDASRAGACVRAGADGVAVMGAVMRAADPGAVAAAVRRALDQAQPAHAPADGRGAGR